MSTLNTRKARWCSATPARWAWRGIVSKRLGSRYRSGRSPDWLNFKNPQAPAVKREAEEDWGRLRPSISSGVRPVMAGSTAAILLKSSSTKGRYRIRRRIGRHDQEE